MFDIAIWLSLAIFIAAITLWIRIKYHYLNPKLSDIQAAISLLQQPGATSATNSLSSFSQFASNNDTLSPAWAAFQHTLYIDNKRLDSRDTDDQSEKNITIATRKAGDFFNETIIDSGKFDLRIASAIPGYLLSVGLMFTFIGLLLALNAAVTLSQAGDLDASTLALQGLLGAAAFKFLTSISGLFSSICFSIALRKNMQHTRNLLDTLCEKIDGQLCFETSEIIALRQTSETRELNAHMIAANRDIAEKHQLTLHQLIHSISNLQQNIAHNGDMLTQHAASFEASTSYLINESGKINRQLASDMRQANEETLQQLVSEFVNKFNLETRRQFQQINQQLNLAQKHFKQITTNLLTAGDQFKTDIYFSGKEIRGKITEASATLNRGFSASANSMIETTNNMERILNSLHKVMDNLVSGTEAILEANKNIGPVSERFEATTRDFIAVVPEISGLTQHFKKFYSIFNEFNSNMRSIDKNKISELNELVEFSRKSTELVKDYQESSISVNNNLRESIDAFHQLIISLNQDLKLNSSTIEESPEKKWNQIN